MKRKCKKHGVEEGITEVPQELIDRVKKHTGLV